LWEPRSSEELVDPPAVLVALPLAVTEKSPDVAEEGVRRR